jgi:hypothetical protein
MDKSVVKGEIYVNAVSHYSGILGPKNVTKIDMKYIIRAFNTVHLTTALCE